MDWAISEKRAYEFVSAPTIEHLVQELNEAAENGYEICGGPIQKGSLYYCILRRAEVDLGMDLDDLPLWAGDVE